MSDLREVSRPNLHPIYKPPAFRQRLQKPPSIRLGQDTRIENDHHARVVLRADEAAEALLQLDDGLRDLVVVERVAAGFVNGFDAGFDDRAIGRKERQLTDDDVTQGLALDVDAVLEAVDAEHDAGRAATEL